MCKIINVKYIPAKGGRPRFKWQEQAFAAQLIITYIDENGQEMEFNIIDDFHSLVGNVLDRRVRALWNSIPYKVTDVTRDGLKKWFQDTGLI